jgi:hypothetical protein
MVAGNSIHMNLIALGFLRQLDISLLIQLIRKKYNTLGKSFLGVLPRFVRILPVSTSSVNLHQLC